MNRAFVICATFAVGACTSLLGFGEPGLDDVDAGDASPIDGGIGDDAGVPDAGGGTSATTHVGMTSVGPEGAYAAGLRIIDPRFEIGEQRCTAGLLCISGGITP